MTTQLAVVPLRAFGSAKRRLAGSLSPALRELLVARMATKVVQTLLEVMPTAVVSADTDVLHFAESLGARPLREAEDPTGRRARLSPADALNVALSDTAAWAADEGVRTLAVVFGDLPAIRAEDVHALLRLPGRPGLTLAPDRDGVGTNALAVSPPEAMHFMFGPDSFLQHRMAATRAELRVKVLRRPGFEHDVDTPEDVAWALEAGLPDFDPALFRETPEGVRSHGSPP